MNVSEITVKKKESNELVTRIFEDEEGIKEITSDDYIVEVEDNGWIPVEERLPEDTNGDFYQSVIVTLSNGRVASGVYRNYDDEWWVEDESGEKKYMRSNEIIAWMPLPEPYQGEEK